MEKEQPFTTPVSQQPPLKRTSWSRAVILPILIVAAILWLHSTYLGLPSTGQDVEGKSTTPP